MARRTVSTDRTRVTTESAGPESSHVDARLDEIMARLAAGDPYAATAFYQSFGAAVRNAVGRLALGEGVQPRAELVDAVTVSFCFETLPRLAPAWRPGGARPWVWARQRLQALIRREAVGLFTDPLDERVAASLPTPAPGPAPVDDATGLLAGAARTDSRAALVLEALHRVGPPEQVERVLQYALAQAEGCRAPAEHVARTSGRSTAAVRQEVHRVRTRLRELAEAEARFAPLAEHPALVGRPPRRPGPSGGATAVARRRRRGARLAAPAVSGPPEAA